MSDADTIAEASDLAATLVRRLRAELGNRFNLEVPYAFAIGLISVCRAGAVDKAEWEALARDILNNAIEFAKAARPGK